MKEFVFIFRSEGLLEEVFEPQEAQTRMKVWENWIDDIIARNILVSRGNRLGAEGATVKIKSVVIYGPYVEAGEIIGGYIIIRAASLNNAVEIVKDCPSVLDGRLSAEVRAVYAGNN
jgi:hypothetical protein